jgi:hypothetical protein
VRSKFLSRARFCGARGFLCRRVGPSGGQKRPGRPPDDGPLARARGSSAGWEQVGGSTTTWPRRAASPPALVLIGATPEPSAAVDLAWRFIEQTSRGSAVARRNARSVERVAPDGWQVEVRLSTGEHLRDSPVHEAERSPTA